MKPTPDGTSDDDADPPAPPAGPGEAPPAAELLFPSDRLALAERYADLLATDGVVRGLIGPREAPRLWPRHLVNCALMAGAVPEGARVADIGSGAGLPGLVLAIARPDISMTLVEPLLRRTRFLDEAVAALGLDNVTVRRDRADALHGGETFDIVTARAVAPLDRLLGWCMPLVAPTGALVAMKGASIDSEIVAAGPVLERLGCGEPVVEVYGEELLSNDPTIDPIRLVRVTWRDPARVGLPASASRRRRPDGRAGAARSNRRRSRQNEQTSRRTRREP